MEVLQMSEHIAIKSSIRDYQVKFSDSLESNLEEIVQSGDYLIVDQNVVSLHEDLRSLLSRFDNIIYIEAIENTKSYQSIIPYFEELISNGFKRNNRLIAIGGGITQDTTAFMASILYRGVDWIFFPTTLLAQADSCIGSKTSINFKKYKNQLGNFYPPKLIFIDPSYLNTLDERAIRSGIGEMAHYYYVSGENDVEFFENEFEEALDDQSNLKKLIKKSLTIKKEYIEIDEFDQNERLVFNYGHTFGHAIESITDYRIPHGVSVTFGMDMANFVSWKKGYISIEVYQRARNVYQKIWEDYDISNIDISELISAMEKDKKNERGKLGLILTKGWGKMFKDLTEPNDLFKSWMEDYINNYQI